MNSVYCLIYCAGNTLFYSFAKYFHLQVKTYSTLEIMRYVNILSFILISPYILLKIKKIISSFNGQFKLTASILASFLKIYTIQYISIKNATIITFTMPIFVIIISLFTIEKFTKFSIKKYFYVPVSFIGVIIFTGYDDIKNHIFIYFILFLHVILRAFVNIFIKKLSHEKYITLSYSLLFYCIFGLCIVYQNFNIEMLYDWHIILIAVINIFTQLSLIKAYSDTKSISLLQNLDYSKIMFTFLWCYLFFNENITANQIIGASIICISVYFSQLNFSKFKIKKL